MGVSITEKHVDVPVIQTVEKIVEVPHVQVVEKVIEVPMVGETIQGSHQVVHVPLPPVRQQAPAEHVTEHVVGPDLPAEQGAAVHQAAASPPPVTHAAPVHTMVAPVTHVAPVHTMVAPVAQAPVAVGGSVSIPAVATTGGGSVSVVQQSGGSVAQVAAEPVAHMMPATTHMMGAPAVTYAAPPTTYVQ